MTERDKELIIEDLRGQYCDGKITGAELADRVAATCEQWMSEKSAAEKSRLNKTLLEWSMGEDSGPPGYENNDW